MEIEEPIEITRQVQSEIRNEIENTTQKKKRVPSQKQLEALAKSREIKKVKQQAKVLIENEKKSLNISQNVANNVQQRVPNMVLKAPLILTALTVITLAAVYYVRPSKQSQVSEKNVQSQSYSNLRLEF
jgi:hypothetical protein